MTETTFTDDSGDVRFSGKIRMGGTAGQVATVQSNGTLAPAAGGGSQTVKRVAVPFAFDDPDILTGKTIYVPNAGDFVPPYISLVSITTAFDGTTPKLDLGVPEYLGGIASEIDATQVDNPVPGGRQPSSLGSTNGFIFDGDPEYPCVLTLSDGSDGDPGSMQGEGVVYLIVAVAP